MNSNNPFLNNKTFSSTTTRNDHSFNAVVTNDNQDMTLSGTINRSLILFLLLTASATVTWWATANELVNPIIPIAGGAIIGLILVIIAAFKPENSPYLAPGYALFEGLFIGGVSVIFEAMYPGVVTQAVGATFVTFAVCLGLYKYKIVKVTEQFKSIVIAATLAIATYYLFSWLFSLFTSFVPVHYGNSMTSIGISVFVIVIAALNLFLDFDRIEQGVQQRMPKYMEWYGAMGLMITLVWLYIEFLRLFAKLAKK